MSAIESKKLLELEDSEYSKSVKKLIAAGLPPDLAFKYFNGYLLHGEKFREALNDLNPGPFANIFSQTIYPNSSRAEPASEVVSQLKAPKSDLEQKSNDSEKKSKNAFSFWSRQEKESSEKNAEVTISS